MSREGVGLPVRIRHIWAFGAPLVLLAWCALLVVADPLTAEELKEYSLGFDSVQPFQFVQQDDSISVSPDGTVFTFVEDGLRPGAEVWATSAPIVKQFDLGLGSGPGEKVSFQKFLLHIDASGASFTTIMVRFTSNPDSGNFSGVAITSGEEDPTGALVFRPKVGPGDPFPGGDTLQFKLWFKVTDGGTPSGTITVDDFTLVYGKYVAPPDDDGDGGGSGGNDNGASDRDGDKDKPSGVAYMGGSDSGSGTGTGGSGTGSGGSGTGSGQGGGNSAGVRVGEGTGSIDTEAPVTASPRSTAGDTITGYPLRLEDVLAGGGSGDGSGDGAGGSSGTPGSGSGGFALSLQHLLWVAAALAVMSPFAGAALDRRRVRRRLKDLVEETPDGPAPRVTAPA